MQLFKATKTCAHFIENYRATGFRSRKKVKKGPAEGFSNFKDGAGMHVALKQISLVISKGVDFPLIDFFAQRIIRVTGMIHIRNNLITAATFNAFAANLGLREAPVFLLL